jgi:hypothetical protein
MDPNYKQHILSPAKLRNVIHYWTLSQIRLFEFIRVERGVKSMKTS